mmetsp:Transcript_12711/g.16112  ORF Transcript_12711/g.16112 Transcript_12711/m.16112 type:complete len:81 (-) Transcript_12711:53-295(-)
MDTNVRPDEIPDGFTAADPTQANAGPDSKQAQKQAQQEQKRSILEQSLTPEALARLGTIKVGTLLFFLQAFFRACLVDRR